MPYIPVDTQRKLIDDRLGASNLVGCLHMWGDLNYLITRIVLQYLIRIGLNYDNCQSVRGLFKELSDEFRSRVVLSYEFLKREANGDVPEYEILEKMISQKFETILRDRKLQ